MGGMRTELWAGQFCEDLAPHACAAEQPVLHTYLSPCLDGTSEMRPLDWSRLPLNWTSISVTFGATNSMVVSGGGGGGGG
jgi:hypothetical protein